MRRLNYWAASISGECGLKFKPYDRSRNIYLRHKRLRVCPVAEATAALNALEAWRAGNHFLNSPENSTKNHKKCPKLKKKLNTELKNTK